MLTILLNLRQLVATFATWNDKQVAWLPQPPQDEGPLNNYECAHLDHVWLHGNFNLVAWSFIWSLLTTFLATGYNWLF